MNNASRIGFKPTGSSLKKIDELARVPGVEPRALNNYFTIMIDPSAVLLLLLLCVIVLAAVRYLLTARPE
jgi:hypothetical protein